MAAVGAVGAREAEKTTEKLNIVDVDIHERLMPAEVARRLPQPFRHYMEVGWWIPKHMPYIQPTAGGLDRADARLPDGRPGGADIEWVRKQCLDDCEVECGILTGWTYPSMMRAWPELATALATVVNDIQMEEWLSKDDRFYGSIHINARDVQGAVREIERCAEHPKMVQVILPIEPIEWGDPYFLPIYKAAEKHGLVFAFHHSENTPTCVSSLMSGGGGYPRYYITWHSLVPQMFMAQLASIIFNGVCDACPDLKFAFIEGGFTWVPHVMWKFDQQYKMLRHEVPWVKRLPSRIIREQVRFATQPLEELSAKDWMQLIDQMGSDELVMFSTDYPHWDFDHPREALPADLPEEIKRKVWSENAKKIYTRLPRGTAARA
jgi:predicted TIM-barrel fold metal-dependent hydrolase